MFSSVNASTTWSLELTARSESRIAAARSMAATALSSDSSASRFMILGMIVNTASPNTNRMTANVPAYHAVSCSRSRVSGRTCHPASGPEPVTSAANGVNQLGLEVIVDLASQPPHQHFKRVGERIVGVVQDVGGDGRPVDDLALVPRKELEQGEFLGRQRDRPIAPPHLARIEIDVEVDHPHP